MIMNDLKISLEMKNKDWLSIEKIILKSRKMRHNDQNIYFY